MHVRSCVVLGCAETLYTYIDNPQTGYMHTYNFSEAPLPQQESTPVINIFSTTHVQIPLQCTR